MKTVKIKVSGVLIKTKPNLKIIDKQFPETIPGNFISTSILHASYLLDLLAVAAYLKNFERTRLRQHYSS